MRTFKALAAFLAGALLAAAAAQDLWAVQVVALRDYREAQAATTELARLGFPAYSEFAMNRGQQFVRVRVGCFTTREAADAMATAMRGRVTADAQPVELSPTASAADCAEEAVGFLNGYDWELQDAGGPVSFGVSVAGVAASVVHDGERWRMVQDDGQAPPLSPAAGSGAVRETSMGGVPFAVLERSGTPLVLCPGRLLAQVGAVAIVERGDAVLACRLRAGGSP